MHPSFAMSRTAPQLRRVGITLGCLLCALAVIELMLEAFGLGFSRWNI